MTPELLALLRSLTTRQLDHLRMYAIPAELRERVAAERGEEFAAYTADYAQQAKPKG